MAFADKQSERIFRLLTPEQQAFLDKFIATDGDADAAAIAAKPELTQADRRAIRSAAGKFLKDPNIDILQRKHFSPDDISPEDFLRFLWSTIKKETDGKTIASLAALYAKVRETTDPNWNKGNTPAQPKPKDAPAESGSSFDDFND
jgi:hypothetical protein